MPYAGLLRDTKTTRKLKLLNFFPHMLYICHVISEEVGEYVRGMSNMSIIQMMLHLKCASDEANLMHGYYKPGSDIF